MTASSSPASHRVRRPARTRRLVALGAVLAALLLILLTTGRAADPAPGKDTAAPLPLTETHQIFTDTVAASKGTTATLIAPTGKDWWRLVTSLAPTLYLWDVPQPRDALWYGATAGTSYASGIDVTAYQAVHVGFASKRAAESYIDAAFATARNDERFPLRRGTVVTFAPPWLDITAEPYPKSADLTATSKTLKPTAGAWYINLGGYLDTLSDQNPTHADALRRAFGHLGFTDATAWTATSEDPAGPWTGTLHDYDPAAVNVRAAAETIIATTPTTCSEDGKVCWSGDGGLDVLNSYLAWHSPGTGDTYGVYAAQQLPATPANAVLTFAVNHGQVEGLINGLLDAPASPVSLIQGAVVVDAGTPRLTLHTAPTEPSVTPR